VRGLKSERWLTKRQRMRIWISPRAAPMRSPPRQPHADRTGARCTPRALFSRPCGGLWLWRGMLEMRAAQESGTIMAGACLFGSSSASVQNMRTGDIVEPGFGVDHDIIHDTRSGGGLIFCRE
jgi:hypothetical protein